VRTLVRVAIGAALLVLCCGAPSTVDPPLPSKLGRDEAIALVRHRIDIIGRIDRADAKLLTLDEYLRVAGPLRVRGGDPQATPVATFEMGGDRPRYVWAVAISGQVWPSGRVPVWFGGYTPPVSPTPHPPYRWAIFLVDAGGGTPSIVDAGAGEAWPAVFANLPSHDVAP
jgi:hypothetical protein